MCLKISKTIIRLALAEIWPGRSASENVIPNTQLGICKPVQFNLKGEVAEVRSNNSESTHEATRRLEVAWNSTFLIFEQRSFCQFETYNKRPL